ncbi:EspF repeat-containing protein [Escherichia coli]
MPDVAQRLMQHLAEHGIKRLSKTLVWEKRQNGMWSYLK